MTHRINHVTIMILFVLATAGACFAAAGETARITDQMTGSWQLFIDDYLIASKKNVVRRYHQFRKHPGNPLIIVDRPWEKWVVSVCTVLPGEDGTGFKMYYYCWSEPTPPKKRWNSFMCYAESKDGLKWEKPNLGQREWRGDGTKNNNILSAPGHVMFTPWEKEPQKRYQGAGGGGGYYAYSSPDGIHWKKASEESIVSGGDTSHFYWDPHTKQYRCTVKGGASAKVSGNVSGLRRRVGGFSETPKQPGRSHRLPDGIPRQSFTFVTAVAGNHVSFTIEDLHAN